MKIKKYFRNYIFGNNIDVVQELKLHRDECHPDKA